MRGKVDLNKLPKASKGAAAELFDLIQRGDLAKIKSLQNTRLKKLIHQQFLKSMNFKGTLHQCAITPLFYAIVYFQWQLAIFFLENSKNKEDINLMCTLVEEEQSAVQGFIEYLRGFELEKNTLNTLLNLFLEKGADFTVGGFANNLMVLASPKHNISIGFFEKLSTTFKSNINDNVGSTGTPLHALSFHKRSDLIDIFIKQGAKPNIHNSMSDTPLSISVKKNDLSSIAALVRGGADVNLPLDPYYPLHIAMYHNFLPIVKAFVEDYQCDLNIAYKNAHIFKTDEIKINGSNQPFDLKSEPIKFVKNSGAGEAPNASLIIPKNFVVTPLALSIILCDRDIFAYLFSKSPQSHKDNLPHFLAILIPQISERIKSFIQQQPELLPYLNSKLQTAVQEDIEAMLKTGRHPLAIKLLDSSDPNCLNLSSLLKTGLILNAENFSAHLLDKYSSFLKDELQSNSEFMKITIGTYSSSAILRMLTEHKANIRGAMHVAVECGNLKAMDILFNYQRECLNELVDSRTPLLQAALCLLQDSAQKLLNLGADPFQTCEIGNLYINVILIFGLYNSKETIARVFQLFPNFSLTQTDISTDKKITYLKFAFDAKNKEAFLRFFEWGARDSTFINKAARSWITSLERANINEWFDSVTPHETKSAESVSSVIDEITSGVEATQSVRSYLIGDLHYSKDWFKENETLRKTIQSEGHHSHFFSPSVVKQNFIWLDLFSTDNDNIVPILRSTNCYLYLDRALLKNQGCEDMFIDRAYFLPAFNGKKIKKLNSDKLCTIRLGSQEMQTSFTHEIRFPGLPSRILICPILDKTGSASLYIGTAFLPNGLHENSDQRSLFLSTFDFKLNSPDSVNYKIDSQL